MKFLEDEFLRNFICRFLFCYAVISQHKPSIAKGTAALPTANPAFPQAVIANKDVLDIAHRLAALLGVEDLFSEPSCGDGVVLKRPTYSTAVSVLIQEDNASLDFAFSPARPRPPLPPSMEPDLK